MEIINFLTKKGALWGDTAGQRQRVIAYGKPTELDDTFDEERQAMARLGIAYRGERDTIVGLGEDLIPLIQGLVTGDVYTLIESGSGMKTCAVNINGRLVFDVRFLHINALLLLDFEAGTMDAGLLSHFKKNIINEDVRFIDRSEGVVKTLLCGSEASDTLSKIATLDSTPDSLQIFDGMSGAFEGDDIIIQRVDFGEVAAFEVTISRDAFIPFFEAAMAQNARPVGERCLESVRIEQAIPRFSVDPSTTLFGVELSDKIIPLEAELNDWISFTKGCYLGQEIIARLDSRGEPAKKLRRFKSSEAIHVGDLLFHQGKKVGEVVSCLLLNDVFIANAYIKRGANEPGTLVALNTKDALENLEVLPF